MDWVSLAIIYLIMTEPKGHSMPRVSPWKVITLGLVIFMVTFTISIAMALKGHI